MKKYISNLLGLMFVLNCFAQSGNETSDTKQFMLFVYSDADRVVDMSSEKQQQHIKKIGSYIENLAKMGKLKNAQPLEMEGAIISGNTAELKDKALQKKGKVIAGYYHILAKDLNEAIKIAKSDPRFEESGWEMEIRPIKIVTGIN